MLQKVKVTRNAVLFTAGLLGVMHQTLIENVDRPALLVMFGAMMGLPAFLGREEKKPPPPQQPKAPSSSDASDSVEAEVEE